MSIDNAVLSSTERLILDEITRRVPRGRDLTHASATIAGWVGKSIRTVQVALARLCRLGILRRFLNYKRLKTRRGFRLLFRERSNISVSAENCVQSAQKTALSFDLPPDPPIEVPEGREEREITDDEAPSSLLLSAPPVSPEADQPPTPRPLHEIRDAMDAAENQGDSTAELEAELAALVEQAEPILEGSTRSKLSGFARRWTPDWVRAALGQAKKKRDEDGHVGWGYVNRTLEGFGREGGPPPEARPYSREDELAAIRRAIGME